MCECTIEGGISKKSQTFESFPPQSTYPNTNMNIKPSCDSAKDPAERIDNPTFGSKISSQTLPPYAPPILLHSYFICISGVL